MEEKSAIDEIVFLRQTVHRLNAVLSQYQGIDAFSADPSKAHEDLPSAKWLADPITLSPLIHEYDSQLSELHAQLERLSQESKESHARLQTVNEENKRLHAELQEAIQQQLHDVESSELGNPQDDVMLKNLQSQLELAYRERDAAIEMNKETVQLLDKMRFEGKAELSHIKSQERIFNETKARNEQLEDANLKMQQTIEVMHKENQAFALATTQQMNELKRVQEQQRESKLNLRQSSQREDDYKKMVDSLKHQITSLDEERKTLQHNERMNLTMIQQLENSVVETEGKLAQALQYNTNAQSQMDSLKIRIVALEKTNSEIEGKEMNYLMQIRESAQLLDDALLARDSALIREKQRQEDVEKASVAMETLVDEVADRIRSEVDKVNAQAEVKIQRLVEEIETLELEAANLRSDADRAKRAKRNAEEELESVIRQRKEDQNQPKLEEFQRRTINAERARDDALITIQSLEDRLQRTRMESEDEKMGLLSFNQSLEQRVNRIQREMEESQHERLHLLETVSQSKHHIQKLEAEARSARLNAAKEFTTSKDTLEREKKQLQCRLKSVDDTNRNSVRQLHKMLGDQQRINARWKEETKSAVERYEDKIKDLQSQLAQNRRKCHDLTNKLQCQELKAPEIMVENIPPVQESHATTRAQSSNDLKIPQLEETNRQLRAKLHTTEYKLLNATQKLGDIQALQNSFTLQDLH
uniref:Sodium channel and clathrin linker 1 n=1 Tax=Phallusia mammillata TaxID=59560 RepID=A0A6F9DR25_9ASCI|nr:sodium channel and clathrin linker 1 [Phallusia mammillata]